MLLNVLLSFSFEKLHFNKKLPRKMNFEFLKIEEKLIFSHEYIIEFIWWSREEFENAPKH